MIEMIAAVLNAQVPGPTGPSEIKITKGRLMARWVKADRVRVFS